MKIRENLYRITMNTRNRFPGTVFAQAKKGMEKGRGKAGLALLILLSIEPGFLQEE